MDTQQIKEALIKESKRIEEDTLYSYAGHWAEARRWNSTNLWIGIPATILAAIAGLSSISDEEGQFAMNLWINKDAFIAIIAFSVATMSALSTFLDAKGQVSKHYFAGNSYKALNDEARIFSEIDCPKNNTIEENEKNLKSLNSKLKELNEQTPLISTYSINKAKKKIESGYYNYKIDKE